MAKHHTRIIVVMAIAMAVGVTALGGFAWLGGATLTEGAATDNVRVVENPKAPAQWTINTAYGRGALSNLRAALNEIAKDNPAEARKGVVVAQSLLSKIAPASAPVRARVAVDAGAHAGLETDQARETTPEPVFVLVHSEIRVLGDAGAADSVQEKLDELRGRIDMSDHEAVIAALESLNVPLVYTRVDLPLSETIARIDDVLQALDSENADLARATILDIGNGLRIETVNVGRDQVPEFPVPGSDAG